MGRIVFVVTEDLYFYSHRLPLALAAKKAGHDVVVATRPKMRAAEIEMAGIRIVPFEMDRRAMNPLKELVVAFRLARLFREEKPDLVHLVALKPVLVGNLAARIAGVKRRISAVTGLGFLFTDNGRGGFLLPFIQWLLTWTMRGSLVIVQNPDDGVFLKRLGISPKSLRLIRGAGVDLSRFRVLPELKTIPVVMLPSRLLWDKGVGEFVEAARILKARGVMARFVLVGEPDTSNPAAVSKEKIDEWTDEGIVEWWGFQNEMEDILPQANLVCLPSYREGLPKVLLEAMSCERAVITCNVPGCREAVVDGENGLLVPPRDSIALARAIEKLLLDPGFRRSLAKAGRDRARRLFSVEKVVYETLGIYNELLYKTRA